LKQEGLGVFTNLLYVAFPLISLNFDISSEFFLKNWTFFKNNLIKVKHEKVLLQYIHLWVGQNGCSPPKRSDVYSMQASFFHKS
jgi:hypothetical protein